MKVLFVVNNISSTGGISKIVRTFIQFRDPDRVEVDLASLVPVDEYTRSALAGWNVPIHVLGSKGYRTPIKQMRILLRRTQPRVVVCNSFKTYVVFKAASNFSPAVLWIHGLRQIMGDPVRKTIFRLLSKRDTLVFVSEAARRTHSYRGHLGKAVTVYNGVSVHDLPNSEVNSRLDLGIPLGSKTIGYTAEFTGWKEHHVLLDAFAILAKEREDLHLLLVGTGHLFDATRKSIRNLFCKDRIHFVGPRRDACRLLSSVDVYAHVSNGEAFGIAVVEAMLAGVPVVASCAGALPEYVQNGKTGILFRTSDPVDLAEKIESLLNNPQMATELAANGKAYCMNHFSPVLFAQRWTKLIEQEYR
jgi:glycosyltransferase involved in cell wall biosynthesis